MSREIKYDLTISIMASNRKDTLPKTLASIKPILDNVSSELIVTDTGCDEDLLDVIRQYTDNIVEFTWCNDFAKARNVGLKLAKGRWFMFIDDDEWFEDATPIIEFFNSGEYKKYNLMHYIVRNYTNMEGTVWDDKPVERGICLKDGVEFVDRIHEHLAPIERPIKLIQAYVHHYGYAYATWEERVKHSRRNLPPLLELLEEKPHIARNYIHVIQEYNILHEYEKSLEMAERGIENVNKRDVTNFRDYGALLANVVLCQSKLGRVEDVIAKGESYLRLEDISAMGQCMINGLLCDAHITMNDMRKVALYARRYFELYNILMNDTEKRMSETSAVVCIALTESVVSGTWYVGLKAAVDMDDEGTVLYMLEQYRHVKKVDHMGNYKWQKSLVSMMGRSSQKEMYADTILAFMEDIKSATSICEGILELKEKNEALFMEVVKHLVENDNMNMYVKLLRTIYFGMTGEVDRLRAYNGENK